MENDTIGNNYLYNELLEYCGGNYNELKSTIDYFMNRIENEMSEKRVCDICGKEMNSGFYNEDTFEYFCSEECLHKKYTEEEYNKLYNNGNGNFYYTEWE